MRALWPDRVKLFLYLTTFLLLLYFLPFRADTLTAVWKEGSFSSLFEPRVDTAWGRVSVAKGVGILAVSWYLFVSILLAAFRASMAFLIFAVFLPWLGIGLVMKCPPMLEHIQGDVGEKAGKFIGYHCQLWGTPPDRFLAEGKEYLVSNTYLMYHVAALAGFSALAIGFKLWRRHRQRATR